MNAERLLGLYEDVVDAPDAIARMRRFILGLAARGKLVPQDRNDEPASELLKRIAAARMKLEKQGEIRKARELAPLENSGFPFKLPAGWVAAPLDRLSPRSLSDGDWIETKDQSENGGVRLIQLADVGEGEFLNKSNRFITEQTEFRLKCTRLEVGDVLIARLPNPIGRACIFPRIDQPAITAVDVAILAAHENVSNEFLVVAINSPVVRQQIEAYGKGATRFRVSTGHLKTVQIPLPPLAEQHRIVAKVNELMALCDRLEAARKAREATRDRLAAASLARLNASDPETFQSDVRFALDALPALTTRPDQIKQLRQTILNLAVRGKLVPQDPNDEPASELIKRNAVEKAILTKSKASRRDSETRICPPLPDGWQWTTLSEISLSMRYGTSVKCYYATTGVPVLRIPNVSGGFVSLDDVKFGPLSEAEASELALRSGDILMIRSNGSLDIVGRAAVVPYEARGFAFAGYLVRLRVSPLNIDANFLCMAMNSTEVREQIEKPIRSAVGLKNVNLTEFGSLRFMLPPLVEQRRIVAKADALMSLCDQLEKRLAAAAETRAQLLEAIVAEALSVELGHELEATE